jgi:tetratricopeptide (TPR) repeat protein
MWEEIHLPVRYGDDRARVEQILLEAGRRHTADVVAAATPALILFSQSNLDASSRALGKGNCGRARSEAFKSIDSLSLRPEPYRIVGYCDLQQGRPADAVEAMQKALDNSPRNWESHYGLALALASAGRDPRPEIDRALAMNPLEELLKTASTSFGKAPTPDGWRRAVPDLMQAGLDSGRLTFD